MTILMPNMGTIKSAVFKVLNADATLRDADHLQTSGRIVPMENAPRGVLPPRLHIAFSGPLADGDTQTNDLNVELRAVCANLSGTVLADRKRLGRICRRAAELLKGHNVPTASGYHFFDCWWEYLTDVEVNAEDSRLSRMSYIMRLRVRRVS